MRSGPAAHNGDEASKPLVLIPAFEPNEALLALVASLRTRPEVGGIIVVDDGSGPDYRELFESLDAIVLRHESNQGKGAALKTGLRHARARFPDSVGVVTADADGQHATTDIARVAAALAAAPGEIVIGARSMAASAPLRSRFGNRLARWVMRWLAGQELSDTQTGLRGIPMDCIPRLLLLPATHYDFEMDMLITCREQGWTIREVPISTIYIDHNHGSHFRPVLDSMRVSFIFLRFSGVSLLTAVLDNAVFILAMQLWPYIGPSQTLARLVAGTFQFWAAKRGVFRSPGAVAPALLRFWLLVAATGGTSYLLIRGLLHFTTLGPVPAKLVAETLVFFLSFVAQRNFVFANGPRTDHTNELRSSTRRAGARGHGSNGT
jgi:glycosyltransferase involved in cell wall biosynthesis